MRIAALCTLGLALLAAPSATAAKRGCPMIVDQPRDTVVSWDPVVERHVPHLDLRSVDMRSDDTSVTAVVRVTRLAATSAEAPFGSRWEVIFRASGTTRFLYLSALARGGGQPPTYSASALDPVTGTRMTLADVEGSWNASRSEIRITAPLDVFESVSPLAKGTWLEGITSQSGRLLLPAAGSYQASDATRSGQHRVGTTRCVR